MGSHFHNWTDFRGVEISIELLEWGGTFSIIGHRIDYNGVRALRGQRHIPRKKLPKYPPPDFERLFFRFTQFGGFSTFRILITFVTQDL